MNKQSALAQLSISMQIYPQHKQKLTTIYNNLESDKLTPKKAINAANRTLGIKLEVYEKEGF